MIIFFSIASYCIESHCVESNRNRIVIGVNRIASVPASYVSLMYRIVGYASRCVSYRPESRDAHIFFFFFFL